MGRLSVLTPLLAGSAPALIGLGAFSLLGETPLALAVAFVLAGLTGAAAFFALVFTLPPANPASRPESST